MHMLCHNKQCEINASILLTSFTFLCQIIFTLFFSRPIRYEHNIYNTKRSWPIWCVTHFSFCHFTGFQSVIYIIPFLKGKHCGIAMAVSSVSRCNVRSYERNKSATTPENDGSMLLFLQMIVEIYVNSLRVDYSTWFIYLKPSFLGSCCMIDIDIANTKHGISVLTLRT